MQADNSLKEEDYERILKIDAINICVIIGESFAALRGKAMTEKERRAMTNLAAITLLFDDYFDRLNYSKAEIDALMTQGDYSPKNKHEALFRRFFNGALESIDDHERLFHYAKKVFEAQFDSKVQQDANPAYDSIINLTLEKGGYSILFYRSALENPIDEKEFELAYHLGGMIQLGDDIFDTFWDAKFRMKTFTTVSHDLAIVDRDFRSQINKTFAALEKLDYNDSSKQEFKRWVTFAASLSLSALDQLFTLQESTMGFFDAIAYTRKEMICDMQKLKPQWRCMRHFSKLITADASQTKSKESLELISSGQAS